MNRIVISLFVSIVVVFPHAALSAKFQRPNMANLNLFTWDGQSNPSRARNKCLKMYDGAKGSPAPYNFNLSVTPQALPSGGYSNSTFWLINTADDSLALKVTLSLSRNGSSYDVLAPGAPETGLVGTDCSQSNIPVYLKADVAAADAYRVLAGTYKTKFEVKTCAENSSSYGTACKTDKNDVSVTLVVPPLIQVSNLNDLDLGAYFSTGLAPAGDDICVYSNTGAYQLTVTGTAGTAPYGATDFVFAGDVLPYTIKVGDSAVSANRGAVQNGVAETGMSTGQAAGAYDVNCTANNAYIEASVLQSDLDGTPAGNYLDTITVTAIME